MIVQRRAVAPIMIRLFCALALAATAFAHKPAIAAATGIPDLSAYTLPDGTLPSLCVTGDQTDGGFVVNHCEFCRIAAAIALPPPSGVFTGCDHRAPILILQAFNDITPASTTPQYRPPRGPPANHQSN